MYVFASLRPGRNQIRPDESQIMRDGSTGPCTAMVHVTPNAPLTFFGGDLQSCQVPESLLKEIGEDADLGL